jgi:hypothetical protein
VPFGITLDAVRETVRSATNGPPLSGLFEVYLPVWMFTFAGQESWEATSGRKADSTRLVSRCPVTTVAVSDMS